MTIGREPKQEWHLVEACCVELWESEGKLVPFKFVGKKNKQK